MKPDVHPVAVVVGVTIVAGLSTLMFVSHQPADHPATVTTTASITTHVQPATGVHAIPPPPIKEAAKGATTWTTASTTPPMKAVENAQLAPASSATVGARTVSPTSTIRASDVKTESIEQNRGVSSQPSDDPYRDTMLPSGGSKWETPNSIAPATNSTVSASASPKLRAPSVTAASAASISPSSTPNWTRCSTSWSQTLSLGKSGEQIWTFSTTLSDADVQDLATAVRWRADIVAKYPTVARNYAWLDCAGWRVRDYHQHGSNVPPADYYGAQGLDSPLGTCHSTTPFRRAGAGRCSQQSDELGCSAPGAMSTLGVLGGTKGDDGKVRGWVRWHGDWYVGVVEDATCTDSCAVGFDHPCDLSEETEQPARRWDVAGKMFYSWWYGGDVNGEPPW